MKDNKNVVRYANPFTLFDRTEFVTSLDRVVDRLFEETFPTLSHELGTGIFQYGSYPKVDIKEYKDKVVIEAEIPGLAKDDIDIQVKMEGKEKCLILTCNKNEEVKEEGVRYLHKELKRSRSQRSFLFGDNLNEDDINAEFKNGNLTITIAKKVEDPKLTEPRKIEIKEPFSKGGDTKL